MAKPELSDLQDRQVQKEIPAALAKRVFRARPVRPGHKALQAPLVLRGIRGRLERLAQWVQPDLQVLKETKAK